MCYRWRWLAWRNRHIKLSEGFALRDKCESAYNEAVPSASIRIRPIRFGFLVDPRDRRVLRQVLQLNSCLWGGVYNYLLPVPKRAPSRYRDYTFTELGQGLIRLKLITGTGPSAPQLVTGLLETFQPDFLVESKPGLSTDIAFDKRRVLTLEQFNEEKN